MNADQLKTARGRVLKAKVEWSKVAVGALIGEANVAERVQPVLEELTAARSALTALFAEVGNE